MYYYFFPLWQEYFEQIGCEVVVSEPTNAKILNQGVKLAVDDLCLPFKAYYGHVLSLKDQVDYIFLPRYLSLGKDNKVCPKLMGLPDMITSSFRGQLPEVLAPDIDLNKGIFCRRNIYHYLGRILGCGFWQREYAYWQAWRQQKKYIELQQQGYTPRESIAILNGSSSKEKFEKKTGISLAVLGHSYIINDDYLSMNLIQKLRSLFVRVITQNMIQVDKIEQAARKQAKKMYWYFNRQIIGGAYHFLFNQQTAVDGLIHVSSFGCGPDAMTGELVEIKSKKNKKLSLLNINLDEHSGQAGLITRLEAFIDLLERRKKNA